MAEAEIQRDEKGRILHPDGWPLSGCATIAEAMAVSSLSRSKIYLMITQHDLEAKKFGKARRITWQSLRKAFLTSEAEKWNAHNSKSPED